MLVTERVDDRAFCSIAGCLWHANSVMSARQMEADSPLQSLALLDSVLRVVSPAGHWVQDAAAPEL